MLPDVAGRPAIRDGLSELPHLNSGSNRFHSAATYFNRFTYANRNPWLLCRISQEYKRPLGNDKDGWWNYRCVTEFIRLSGHSKLFINNFGNRSNIRWSLSSPLYFSYSLWCRGWWSHYLHYIPYLSGIRKNASTIKNNLLSLTTYVWYDGCLEQLMASSWAVMVQFYNVRKYLSDSLMWKALHECTVVLWAWIHAFLAMNRI